MGVVSVWGNRTEKSESTVARAIKKEKERSLEARPIHNALPFPLQDQEKGISLSLSLSFAYVLFTFCCASMSTVAAATIKKKNLFKHKDPGANF